jgi:hypothetical protein
MNEEEQMIHEERLRGNCDFKECIYQATTPGTIYGRKMIDGDYVMDEIVVYACDLHAKRDDFFPLERCTPEPEEESFEVLVTTKAMVHEAIDDLLTNKGFEKVEITEKYAEDKYALPDGRRLLLGWLVKPIETK